MKIVDPLFKQIVHFSAEKHDIHAKVQPQHNNHNRCQASVHIGKTFENIHIHGKDKGCKSPSNRCEYRTRQLTPKSSPLIRQKHIDAQRKYNQNQYHDDCSCLNNEIHNVLEYRHILVNKHTDTVTKSQEYQAQNDCQQKQYRIDRSTQS